MRVRDTVLVAVCSLTPGLGVPIHAQFPTTPPPPPAATHSHPAYLATVQGKVTDKATGKALSDATVSLEGTRAGDRSKKDGMYKFTTAATGAQKLTVKYIGYKTMTVEINLADGKTVTQDFQM